MRPIIALVVFVISACGVGVRRVPDASPSDVPARDAATECSGRVAPGLSCAAGARPCLGEDQCNDCFCTAGVWVCGSRVCADAGVCPSGRPRSGDPCERVGQSCSYGAGCAGAECLCAGGRWTCDAFYCPDQ